MRYGKEKARLRKLNTLEIETSLKFYQEKWSADPSTENYEQLDYLSKGAIIRSRGFGGKRGVRSAECGVWKMRSVENEECGK